MDPGRWLVTRGKLNLGLYAGEVGNTACEVYDGYYHPEFDGGAVSGGPAVDPYDRHRSVANSGRCGTATRT
ncbi:hypothetical protein LRE75_19235 [Streptomyces sp. 372A]